MTRNIVWSNVDDAGTSFTVSGVEGLEGRRGVRTMSEEAQSSVTGGSVNGGSNINSKKIDSVELLSMKSLFVMCMWYTFSFSSLFLNKYILDFLQADVLLFTVIHMAVATLLGFMNTHCPCYLYESSSASHKKELLHRPSSLSRHILLLGLIRVLVVLLSLLSLKAVALSFMETVKSSAPLFTVLISYVVLREHNGLAVQLSLLPIMFGLILCSAYELSFTWIGFLAVSGANLAECMKFVLSKTSLSNELHKMTPAEFQMKTCGAGLLLIVPTYLLIMDMQTLLDTKVQTILIMILNAVLFHFQTMMAWILMEFLSPVTHSVCNTVKCALAVWISVPIFGNEVTLMSGLGSLIVLCGVFLYNRARSYERQVKFQTAHSTSLAASDLLSGITPIISTDDLKGSVPVSVSCDVSPGMAYGTNNNNNLVSLSYISRVRDV